MSHVPINSTPSQLIQSHYHLISLISSNNNNNQSIKYSVFILNPDSTFIMSDEGVYHSAPKTEECVETSTVVAEPETVEKSDRGLFDMFGKKDEEKKCEEAAISSEFEQKVQVSHPEPEEKKESLLEKLHRSDSSSSSVSFLSPFLTFESNRLLNDMISD